MGRILRSGTLLTILGVFLLLASSTGIASAILFFQQTHPASLTLQCPGFTIYTVGINQTAEDILTDYTPIEFGVLMVNGGLESDVLSYWAVNTDSTEDVHFGISLNSIAPELTLMAKSFATVWTEVPADGTTIQLSDGDGIDPTEVVAIQLKLVVDPDLATTGDKSLEIVFSGDTSPF